MNDQTAPATPPKNGLSVTSLVLGISGVLCLGILTGIPAIITGHIAQSRARRLPQEYGGRGLAIAGLVMGYISIVSTLFIGAMLAAVMLPALAKAKSRAQTVACVNNLKQVGLAARLWANDHGNRFPPDFISMSNELSTPKVLVCPQDSLKTKVTSWAQFSESENASYELLTPGAKEEEVLSETTFRCPVHGNVALGDGSVQQRGSMRRRR